MLAEVSAGDVDQIWRAAQEEMRFHLARGQWDTWIRNTTLAVTDAAERAFRVTAPSKLARDWLEDRYAALIRETLAGVLGCDPQDLSLAFVKTDAVVDEPPADEEARPDVEVLDNVDLDLNPKLTFSTYVVGNHSRFAHAACRAVAETPGKAYNPLFLYGGVGLGKTHLMQAIGHAVRAKFKNKKVAYVTSEQFMNEMITSISESRMTQFRNTYRTADVLLIDDIQFLVGKDRTQEEFFHTFNTLHEINRQIVISSDRPPREIPTEDRIRSRFEWGLIADIQPPDYETRLAILHSKLQDGDERRVSEDVLSFMAHSIQHNIRELEGALTRVLAYAAIHQVQVDMDIARQLLRDIVPETGRRPVTIDRVQQITCSYYGISMDELKGKRRDKHIVFPRQMAMYIIREEIATSLPAIGQAFGNRDHTTVLHSCDKIRDCLREDPDVRRDMDALRQQIFAGAPV